MVKAINSGLSKKVVVVLMAIITALTCFSVKASAASYVETVFVADGIDGTSAVFTVPSTDNILSVSLRAYTVSGQPSTGYVKLMKKGFWGWSEVKKCTIAVNNITATPWQVFSVSPNENYKIVCAMDKYSGYDCSFNLVVSFSSGNA